MFTLHWVWLNSHFWQDSLLVPKMFLIVISCRLNNNMIGSKKSNLKAWCPSCPFRKGCSWIYLGTHGAKPLGQGVIIWKFHETHFKIWITELIYIQVQFNYSYLFEDLTVSINKQQIKSRPKFILYKQAKPKEPWVEPWVGKHSLSNCVL